MQFKGSWITKVIAFAVLGLMSAAGVALCKIWLDSPWYWVGASLPLIVVYLLGALASKK